ncbi:hypothetical protein CCR75_006219 [Bremia lactucae]|uniref:Uncharacterized protein n=1 Tax=Bremia lactucae TaxID=4779 RepID=A0A976IDE6_BRELC|nr:hypothetical protein CCR75_006219 [Bremia lactucae]
MNLMNVEAITSPSPIIAASSSTGIAIQNSKFNNSMDANGAGSSIGGMDGRDIEGGAAVVGFGSNLCSKRLLKNVNN